MPYYFYGSALWLSLIHICYPDVSAPGEGVVAGWGTIGGRSAYVAAQNYAVLRGSFSVAHAQKICKVIDMAAKNGLPVLFLWDSGGARVQEGAAAMAAYSMVIKKLTDISGAVSYTHPDVYKRQSMDRSTV